MTNKTVEKIGITENSSISNFFASEAGKLGLFALSFPITYDNGDLAEKDPLALKAALKDIASKVDIIILPPDILSIIHLNLLKSLYLEGIRMFPSPFTLEKTENKVHKKAGLQKAHVSMELSLIICRGKNGNTEMYTVSENIYSSDGFLKEVRVPANISPKTALRIKLNVFKTIDELNEPGVFSVKILMDSGGDIEITEISPWPLSFGLYTLSACDVSQFEQFLLIASGSLPKKPRLLHPAVTINIPKSITLAPEDIKNILSLGGTKIYVYNDILNCTCENTGHITIVSESLSDAVNKSRKIYRYIE